MQHGKVIKRNVVNVNLDGTCALNFRTSGFFFHNQGGFARSPGELFQILHTLMLNKSPHVHELLCNALILPLSCLVTEYAFLPKMSFNIQTDVSSDAEPDIIKLSPNHVSIKFHDGSTKTLPIKNVKKASL